MKLIAFTLLFIGLLRVILLFIWRMRALNQAKEYEDALGRLQETLNIVVNMKVSYFKVFKHFSYITTYVKLHKWSYTSLFSNYLAVQEHFFHETLTLVCKYNSPIGRDHSEN